MSVLQMSISAGLLVIAIVSIRSVGLNRLPKKMFLVLWGVVLVRLLLPVSIPLPFSLPHIFSEASRTVLPGTAAPPVIESAINADEITAIPETAEQTTEAAQKKMPDIPAATVIWLVWLTGMSVLFTFFALIY